jgi:hypothetical protein
MRTTHYTPLAPCPHGERTDRTTSAGTPLCPLCRVAEARRSTIDPNMPDWAALAAGDDTQDDDDELTAPDPEPAADTTDITFGQLFGQESGNRIQAMLQRWTEREPEGILF